MSKHYNVRLYLRQRWSNFPKDFVQVFFISWEDQQNNQLSSDESDLFSFTHCAHTGWHIPATSRLCWPRLIRMAACRCSSSLDGPNASWPAGVLCFSSLHKLNWRALSRSSSVLKIMCDTENLWINIFHKYTLHQQLTTKASSLIFYLYLERTLKIINEYMPCTSH